MPSPRTEPSVCERSSALQSLSNMSAFVRHSSAALLPSCESATIKVVPASRQLQQLNHLAGPLYARSSRSPMRRFRAILMGHERPPSASCHRPSPTAGLRRWHVWTELSSLWHSHHSTPSFGAPTPPTIFSINIPRTLSLGSPIPNAMYPNSGGCPT